MINLDYIIFILGCFQIGFIVFCVLLFTLPICLPCYRHEPMPRITQHGFPADSKILFVKHVHATVIHDQWYVKSISEYAGARGTTAAKVLAAATSVLGMLQFTLSLLIWSQYENISFPSKGGNSDIYLWRMILYCIGSFACAVIGNAESAISWEHGRNEKIRASWVNDDSKDLTIRETHDALIRLRDLPQIEPSDVKIRPTEKEFEEAINNLHQIIIGEGIVDNVRPPYGYYVYKRYTKKKKESNYGTPYLHVMVSDDEKDKWVYGIIHMLSAVGLIACNTIASLLGWRMSFAKDTAMVFSIIGASFFMIFSLMQWLSGNYDQDIGLDNICGMDITTQKKTRFINIFRCAQYEVENYRCSKKTLGIIFIFVEFIGFGGVVASTGIEAILMYYYGLK